MDPITLIFDFDGTIADTFEQTTAISNLLSSEFNFKKVEPHEILELKHKTSVELIEHLNIPVLKIPYIVARAKSELNKAIHLIEPIEGLKETLQELKSLGYQLGILTSNSLKNVQAFLQANAIDFFDFVQSSSRIWRKNISLNKMINTHGLDPERVLYVGDETRDIDAARSSGVRVIAVTWGYNSSKILKAYQPDFLIHSPQELTSLCRQDWTLV